MIVKILLSLCCVVCSISLASETAAKKEEHGAKADEHGGKAEEGHHAEEPKIRTFPIGDTGPDIKVPTKMWEVIEADQKQKAEQNLTFAPIKVRFVEKNPGVLVDHEFQVELPRGGGEIDLSQFVKDGQGTFRVFFEVEEMKEANDIKVFFISRAKKRKIDGEVWGAGCKKFFDIKSYLEKEGLTKGIEVNTTRSRHLSVLGGTFIFAAGHQISQVTFKDSLQSHLFCGTESKSND